MLKKKNLKYITTAVAVLLIACFASTGVLQPQGYILGSFSKVVNGVIDNGGELKAPQIGSFSAIIPDGIVGRTNSAQGYSSSGPGSGGPGCSGTFLDFGVKLDKGLSNWRLKEIHLNHFLSAPFQNGKSTILLYKYAKLFFVYTLREIII